MNRGSHTSQGYAGGRKIISITTPVRIVVVVFVVSCGRTVEEDIFSYFNEKTKLQGSKGTQIIRVSHSIMVIENLYNFVEHNVLL